MKTTEISNTQDIIDSRDIIARIEELADQRNEALIAPENVEAYREENGQEPFVSASGEDFLPDQWDDESEAEYQALTALASEAEGSPDWTYGETLIRDSYFREYAQDLAEDIGAIPRDVAWPCSCIDWDRAAQELQHDYMRVDFDGVDYWIRA